MNVGSRKAQSLQKALIKQELSHLKDRNLLRNIISVERSDSHGIIHKGRKFLNFSSNDYLGLSDHHEISEAAIKAVKKYGFGSGSSRLLGGTFDPHTKLEGKIAEFKKTESALVFNSGYGANTGIIPSLTGSNDVIYSDELNHASIIDGTRQSRAKVEVYKHRDMEHLEFLLKKRTSDRAERRLIVTDTVFSMDGDIAPLKDLMYLSRKYNALLMIDDAHGTGVLGDSGRGALEHFGIAVRKKDNIIQMGTLSKAAGCFGAFVAGNKDLIKLLISKARSFIYTTSLPPAVAQAGIKAIDIIDSRSLKRRRKLWKNRARLHDGLKDLGFDTLGSETPIIPILIGDINKTLKIGGALYDNGVFAPAIRPPTVPEGMCRIRFSVTSAHTDKDIDYLLKIMHKVKSIKEG